jgi:hypothetical protein
MIYPRGYELDRIIDEYGPYCDNETVYYGKYFMPFAYNLFTEIYDKYLPIGGSGGRICKGELRPEPREEDINMMCGSLGSPSRLREILSMTITEVLYLHVV